MGDGFTVYESAFIRDNRTTREKLMEVQDYDLEEEYKFTRTLIKQWRNKLPYAKVFLFYHFNFFSFFTDYSPTFFTPPCMFWNILQSFIRLWNFFLLNNSKSNLNSESTCITFTSNARKYWNRKEINHHEWLENYATIKDDTEKVRNATYIYKKENR